MNHVIAMICLNCLSVTASGPSDVLVYVGTYTNRGSEGVYVYRLDSATGGLTLVNKSPRLNDPSFVAIDPKGRCVYAVREGGGPAGAIVALSRNQATNEIPHQYLSARKARQRLGWRPLHDLDQALDRTIAWYEEYFRR